MALLDPIKTKINEVNKIAMEEFDIMSSLDEDEDIILEAALRGEEAIIGNDETIEENDIDDDDFVSGDPAESEDPDLGEEDDDLDFSFESTVPSALESVLNDFDEEDEFDPMMDDGDDIDELFDKVVDDMEKTDNEEDDDDEEDEF